MYVFNAKQPTFAIFLSFHNYTPFGFFKSITIYHFLFLYEVFIKSTKNSIEPLALFKPQLHYSRNNSLILSIQETLGISLCNTIQVSLANPLPSVSFAYSYLGSKWKNFPNGPFQKSSLLKV